VRKQHRRTVDNPAFKVRLTVTPSSDAAIYRRLLRYVRPYWGVFAIGLLAMVLGAATDSALPALLKELLDGSFVEKDPQAIKFTPILLVLLFTLRGLADFAQTVALASVSQCVQRCSTRCCASRRTTSMPTPPAR
jgi:ABC-type multidrug transport system fused ATPase/permease subunit